MICFWSEKALAQACAQKDWKDYHPTEIPLAEFLENWCVGMYTDGLLIGTNFDQNLFGYESDPLDLVLELATELKAKGKNLDFQKFINLEDLENQVRDIIAS